MNESFSLSFDKDSTEFSSSSIISEITVKSPNNKSLNLIFNSLSKTFGKQVNSTDEAISLISVFGKKFRKNQEQLKSANQEISRLNQIIQSSKKIAKTQIQANYNGNNFSDDFSPQKMKLIQTNLTFNSDNEEIDLGNDTFKQTPNRALSYNELRVKLQNALTHVRDLKFELNSLQDNASKMNQEVEELVPEDIKKLIPNQDQDDYVVSIVKSLSSHYLAHEASDYTNKRIQEMNSEKEELILQFSKMQEEFAMQKAALKQMKKNESKMKRMIAESERVRKEVCEQNTAKDEQIQTLEEERKKLIRKISEEIRVRDEKIQLLSAAKIGNKLTTSLNISDSSGPSTPIAKDSEYQKKVKQLNALIEKQIEEIKDKDNRLEKQENDMIGLQNELMSSQKEIQDLKKVIDEKNNLIFDYENRKLESSNIEATNTKQIEDLKAKLLDYHNKLDECRKQLQQQLKKPQKVDESNKLRALILDKDAEIENLGESLHILSTEKEELQTSYEMQIKQIEKQSQTTKEKYEKQSQLQKDKIAKLQQDLTKIENLTGAKDVSSVIDQINKLREQNANFIQNIKDDQSQINDLHEELRQMIQENIQKEQQTTKQINILNAQITEKENTVNTLNNTIKEKDDQIIELKSTLQQSVDKSQYQTLQAEKEQIEQELQEKEQFIQQFQESVSNDIETVRKALNEQTQKLNDTIQRSAAKIAKKKEKIENLNNELANVRKENEQNVAILKEKLRKALSESAQLGSEIEDQNKQHSDEVKSLNREIERIKEDHERENMETQDVITKLEAEKRDLTRNNETLRLQYEQSNKKVAKMTKKLSELQASISQNESHMQQLKDSLDRMRNEKSQTVETLKQQLAEKEKQLNETAMSYKELESTRTNMEQTMNEETKANQEKLSIFEKKVRKLQIIISKLKDYITNLQAEKEKYENKFKELKQITQSHMNAASEAQETAIKLNESKATTEVAFSQLTRKYNDLQKDYDEKNAAYQAMADDMQNYRRQLNEKNNELSNAQIQLSKTQTQLMEIPKLQETIKRIQAEAELSQHKLEETEMKLSELSTQYDTRVKELTEQKENAEQKYNELKDSFTSITKPKASTLQQIMEEQEQYLVQEREKYRQNLTKMEQENSELGSRIKVQEKVIADNQKQIRDLKQAISDLNTTMDKTETTFENKLTAKVREIQDARARGDQLKNELDDARNTIQSLREELQTTKLNLKNKNETLTTNLSTVKQQKENTDVALKTIQHQNKEIEKKLAVLEKTLNDRENQLKATSDELIHTKNELEETRKSHLQENEKIKHDIADLTVAKKTLEESLKKKRDEASQYKEILENSVPLADFEKLNKKYLAIKNLQSLSEKKALTIAIDQGTIREQQLQEFLQKEEERKKEIDDLHDQLEEKKDMIRRLQRQIQSDGMKLEEINSKPFVPLEELAAVKKELREKDRALNEAQASIRVLQSQKELSDHEHEEYQKSHEKEAQELRDLVKRFDQKNTTYSELNTKIEVFHNLLMSDHTQNADQKTVLNIIKDSLNDLFDTLSLEPLREIGARIIRVMETTDIASFKPIEDHQVSDKIEEIKDEIYQFPVHLVKLEGGDPNGVLPKLSQVLVLLQQLRKTIADRDTLIHTMSQLIDSQHKAVIKISDSPDSKEILEESERNYAESQKIINELTNNN